MSFTENEIGTKIILCLANLRLGYLLNFGDALLKNGIVRAVNRLPE